jgi:hypothetical protein
MISGALFAKNHGTSGVFTVQLAARSVELQRIVKVSNFGHHVNLGLLPEGLLDR